MPLKLSVSQLLQAAQCQQLDVTQILQAAVWLPVKINLPLQLQWAVVPVFALFKGFLPSSWSLRVVAKVLQVRLSRRVIFAPLPRSSEQGRDSRQGRGSSEALFIFLIVQTRLFQDPKRSRKAFIYHVFRRFLLSFFTGWFNNVSTVKN